MKSILVILFTCHFLASFALPQPSSLGNNLQFQRDLGGLLGGDEPTWNPKNPEQDSEPTTTVSQSAVISKNVPGELLTQIPTSKTKGHSATATDIALITSHSIIGAPAPITTSSSQKASETSASVSTAIDPIVTKQAESKTFSRGSTEWKVIGIATIVITVLGSATLVIVFFDQWWRFLTDMVLGKKEREGVEDLMPDWEKRSWEFKLSGEESRYPSLSTLASETVDDGQTTGGPQHEPENPFVPRPDHTRTPQQIWAPVTRQPSHSRPYLERTNSSLRRAPSLQSQRIMRSPSSEAYTAIA